jgi:hypothetical protein
MTYKTPQTLDKLEIILERLLISEPPAFFQTLNELSRELFNNALLKKAINLIKDKEKSFSKPLDNLKELALKEMDSIHNNIKNYIENNNIKNEKILYTLKLYQNPIEAYGDLLWGRFLVLRRILLELIKESFKEHLDFIQQLTKLDENHKIIEKTFLPAFCEWQKEKNKLEQLEKIQDWYALNKIDEFYQSYDLEIREKSNEPNSELAKRSIALIKYEWLEDPKYYKEYFDIEELKQQAHRLVSSINELLISKNKSDTHLLNKWNKIFYDSFNGNLEINGKNLDFKINTQRHSLLNTLVNSKRKKWPINDLLEKLKINDAQIREAIRGINERVEMETGIRDFIEINNCYVYINQ